MKKYLLDAFKAHRWKCVGTVLAKMRLPSCVVIISLAMCFMWCRGNPKPQSSLHYKNKGVRRMNLSSFHPADCEGISGSGSPRLDRLQCAFKSSAWRLNSLASRAKLKMDASASPPLSKRARALNSYLSNNTSGIDLRSSLVRGGYSVTIGLGTPAQSVSLFVDTGSDLSWLQCQPCFQCLRQYGSVYDPAESSSYRVVECSDRMCRKMSFSALRTCDSYGCVYEAGYADGSGSFGTLSTDRITLATDNGDEHQAPDFVFGCGRNNTGDFGMTAGVIGLGRGSIFFASQLGSVFSTCFPAWNEPLSSTGPLLFGEAAVASNHSAAAAKYTPLIRNSLITSLYYVQLNGISVGGILLDIPTATFEIAKDESGGMIVDTGTTVTMLFLAAYDRVVEAFREKVRFQEVTLENSELDLCFDVRGYRDPYLSFPSMTFHFSGFDLDLPPENYFLSTENKSIACLSIRGTQAPFNVLGSMQQQNFNIIYDAENERLGFAPTKCSLM